LLHDSLCAEDEDEWVGVEKFFTLSSLFFPPSLSLERVENNRKISLSRYNNNDEDVFCLPIIIILMKPRRRNYAAITCVYFFFFFFLLLPLVMLFDKFATTLKLFSTTDEHKKYGNGIKRTLLSIHYHHHILML
jgi:hypothetical protein